jgi:hypothetical protein
MNHLTALVITFSAFGSGLYAIYKFARSKMVSYDTKPIHYLLNKPTKIKKKYKTYRKHKARKRNTYSAVIRKYKLTSVK